MHRAARSYWKGLHSAAERATIPTMPTAKERIANPPSIVFPFSATQKRWLRRRLLAWYRANARDLPWRRSRDPYHIWISEIMLQQTQVATVRKYFPRFVRAFPHVRRLASAEEQQVFRLWEGLGYYRRARYLHQAARRIVGEYGGDFPRSAEELRKLPGIGRYTAGAIASIAFGQREPILEANTVRLLSRLSGYRGDPHSAAGQQRLWQLATELLPEKDVADFNQALMELGSLVCRASEPGCSDCPLGRLCVANALGAQGEIPRAKVQKKWIPLREAAVVVRKNGRVLVRQCAAGERWAGLWDFPRFAIDSHGPSFPREEIVANVTAQTGVRCEPRSLLKTIKHGVTRYRITLECYEAAYLGGQARGRNGSVVRWTALTALRDLPLSTTGRKLAVLLQHD